MDLPMSDEEPWMVLISYNVSLYVHEHKPLPIDFYHTQADQLTDISGQQKKLKEKVVPFHYCIQEPYNNIPYDFTIQGMYTTHNFLRILYLPHNQICWMEELEN